MMKGFPMVESCPTPYPVAVPSSLPLRGPPVAGSVQETFRHRRYYVDRTQDC